MMKQFLLKFLLFSVLLMVMIQIARLPANHYAPNEHYKLKIDYYLKHKNQFNTVFIGSSKTYRHIIPGIYDSLLTDYRISSFNLGAPGTFNPQLYYLFDDFLKIAGDSMKNIIIDLHPLSYIDIRNVNAAKSYYWHTPEYWKFAMDFLGSSDYSLPLKLYYAAGYTSSLFLKYIHFTDYKTQKGEPESVTDMWLGNDMRGYYSLDDNLVNSGGDTNYIFRRTEFLSDTSVIVPRIKAATDDFAEPDHAAKFNKAHFEMLLSMIKKAERKGIHLMFLISPLSEDYDQQLALREHLPDKNVLEVADYHKYPDLYQASLLFDVGHFNSEGSRLFTKYLALETAKKISNPASKKD